MAACDVLVNLRSPTMGETSGSVIRGLSLGKPLLVSDVGWFSELPDGVGAQDPGRRVRGGDDRRRRSSSRPTTPPSSARPRAPTSAREHDLGRVADAYVAALEEAAGGERGHRRGAAADRRGGRRGRARRPGRARPRSRARRGSCERDHGRAGARAVAVPARVWLAAIVVVSIAVRVALARRIVAPWIMVDEIVYSELAKSFAAHGHFLVRGVPSHGYGFVYPVLIAPAWRLFGRDPDAYAAAKAINGVLMSLAAIPAYLLARRAAARAALARRRGARGARPLDALHGDADDRERLLPALPARRAPARARRSSEPTPRRQVALLVALRASPSRRAPRRSRCSPAIATAPVAARARRAARRCARRCGRFAPLYGMLAGGAARGARR